VISYHNESTWSLQDANLALIIKQDGNHDETHNLRLNIKQSSFPIYFTMENVVGIKHDGNHLLILLIFGKSQRLLWEGTLFRQHLKVNQMNTIHFMVHDVCK
jgi:hypothetical protein